MSYQAKDYSSVLSISGLPSDLLNNHFSLYEGYVSNTNKLAEEIQRTSKDSAAFAEMNRRFGWEFNGMRLHELYFENILATPKSVDLCPDIYNKIQIDFGSVDAWREDFKATALMRGIGWVILYHDRWQDRLFNVWIEEHSNGHLAGCRPLLVIDLFEHAFMPAGIRKPDYVDIILNSFDWSSAENRMKAEA
jgi:Fe-Mn family superoxide dismutase